MGVVFAFLGNEHENLALIRELDGVADQVEENLTQPPRVSVQMEGHVRLDEIGQFDSLGVRCFGTDFDGIFDHLREIEIHRVEREFARLDFREIQDVIDDPQQSLGTAGDRHGVIPLPLRQGCFEQESRQANDPVHRGADFMAHVGQELALGAVGFFRHGFCGMELVLGALAFCDVLHRPRHADGFAIRIGQRFALHENHPFPAVGEQEAHFDAARFFLFQRKPQYFGHRVSVLGMHPLNQEVVGRGGDAPGEPKDAENFIGPDELVEHDVPVPTAEMRDALGLGHAPFADGNDDGGLPHALANDQENNHENRHQQRDQNHRAPVAAHRPLQHGGIHVEAQHGDHVVGLRITNRGEGGNKSERAPFIRVGACGDGLPGLKDLGQCLRRLFVGRTGGAMVRVSRGDRVDQIYHFAPLLGDHAHPAVGRAGRFHRHQPFAQPPVIGVVHSRLALRELSEMIGADCRGTDEGLLQHFLPVLAFHLPSRLLCAVPAQEEHGKENDREASPKIPVGFRPENRLDFPAAFPVIPPDRHGGGYGQERAEEMDGDAGPLQKRTLVDDRSREKRGLQHDQTGGKRVNSHRRGHDLQIKRVLNLRLGAFV